MTPAGANRKLRFMPHPSWIDEPSANLAERGKQGAKRALLISFCNLENVLNKAGTVFLRRRGIL